MRFFRPRRCLIVGGCCAQPGMAAGGLLEDPVIAVNHLPSPREIPRLKQSPTDGLI
jgi:hypothetical protein